MKRAIEIPIKYVPFPEQEMFHRDRYKIRFRAIFAGTGGGKTFAGIFEALSWAFENAGSVGIICEPTYDMIKRNLIHQFLEDFLGVPIEASPLVYRYIRSENLLELNCPEPYGHLTSKIYFIGLDKPEAAEGQSVDWVYVDEARLVPKFLGAWESLVRRLRGSRTCVTKNVGAWVTTTPDFPGSDLYNFFVDPNLKDKDSRSYSWSLHDNIHVDKEYKDSIVRTHWGSKAERFVNGKFALDGNLAFNFDDNLHIVDDLPDKEGGFRYMVYGVDWGWTTPSCILAVGIDGDGRAYVVEEFYKKKVPKKRLIEVAKSMVERWGDGKIFCDRSEPESIEDFVRARLRAVANKRGREEGIREVGSRFFIEGDGRPRLFIHRSCVNLRSELIRYVETKKQDDHGVDALRYALGNIEDATRVIQASSGRRKNW